MFSHLVAQSLALLMVFKMFAAFVFIVCLLILTFSVITETFANIQYSVTEPKYTAFLSHGIYT